MIRRGWKYDKYDVYFLIADLILLLLNVIAYKSLDLDVLPSPHTNQAV